MVNLNAEIPSLGLITNASMAFGGTLGCGITCGCGLLLGAECDDACLLTIPGILLGALVGKHVGMEYLS